MNRWSHWLPGRPDPKETAVGIAATAALAGMFVISHDPTATPNMIAAGLVPSGQSPLPAVSTSLDMSDEELRMAILGRWKRIEHGTHIIENRSDGTASMDMQFDLLAGFLYGDRMRLEMTWTVTNGLLSYSVVSGHPKKSSDKLLGDYGKIWRYEFEAVNPDSLHLVLLRKVKEKIDWTRLE